MSVSFWQRLAALTLLAFAVACGDATDDNTNTDPGPQLPTIDPDLNPALIAQRPFGLKVPASYDGTPMPLILALHGLGSSGLEHVTLGGFLQGADQRGYILAYPDGIPVFGAKAWNASCCGAFPSSVNDVSYLRALIADVRDRYNVDPKRIYVQGLSNGAFMAHVLGCMAGDIVAAIAPLAGTMWTGEQLICTPLDPVAVMHTHGTSDTTVRYGGGLFRVSLTSSVEYISAPDTIDAWISKNNCNATPASSAVDVDTTLTGAETDVDTYTGCDNGVTVELWTVNGAEHVPNFSDAYGTAMIDFFYNHPKP